MLLVVALGIGGQACASRQPSDTPATKADILELKEDIRKLYEATEKWKVEMLDSQTEWNDEVHESQKEWHDEILRSQERSKNDLRESQQRWKDEIIRHFDIAFENYRIDLLGAYGDEIQWIREVQKRHGKRLNAIEAKLDA